VPARAATPAGVSRRAEKLAPRPPRIALPNPRLLHPSVRGCANLPRPARLRATIRAGRRFSPAGFLVAPQFGLQDGVTAGLPACRPTGPPPRRDLHAPVHRPGSRTRPVGPGDADPRYDQ